MVRARAQDRAFALMFGNSAPRALPPACYAVWLSRDAIAMAFIFTMPPYIIGRCARSSAAAAATRRAGRRARPTTSGGECAQLATPSRRSSSRRRCP